MTQLGAREDTQALRQAVRFVAIANLAYFAIEFAVALQIGSVSLFADSVDFLEDTAINLLILLALGWSATARARTGKLLTLIILAPGAAAIWRRFPNSERLSRQTQQS